MCLYRTITALLLILALGACSSKQVYEAGTDWGLSKSDCAALISNAERARCEAGREMTYEEYQREREALKNQNPDHDA